MGNASKNDLLDGDLARPMFRLAWPIVVIQLLQVAYNLADTFWLGQYSAVAVGALSIAFPVIFFFISFIGGFTVSASVLVAQYTGADTRRLAGEVSGQALSFLLAVSVCIGLLGYTFSGTFLELLPADDSTATRVFPLANAYLEVFFLGLPFLFIFGVFEGLMRGSGNTRVPMKIMLVSVALNVIVDPILIFGWGPAPEMGIVGAAIATILTRGVGVIIGMYVLLGTAAGPRMTLRDLWPGRDLGHVKDIVRIGVPTSLEQSSAAISHLALMAVVVTFAPSVVAAYGLVGRLMSLVYLPAVGLGQATNTVVGQNLGAGKPQRGKNAVRLASTSVVGVMVVLVAIAATIPQLVVGVFMGTGSAEAADTIVHGSEYLRIRSVEFVFIGVLQVLLGAFRGAGNTTAALGMTVVATWLVRVPTVCALVFLFDWGPRGLWIGMATGDIVAAILAALWFSRGTWTNSIIDETRGMETD